MAFDKFKDKLSDALDQHGETIDRSIDKAAAFANQRTGGKHSDKIASGVDRAKRLIDDNSGNATSADPADTPDAPGTPAAPGTDAPATPGGPTATDAPGRPGVADPTDGDAGPPPAGSPRPGA